MNNRKTDLPAPTARAKKSASSEKPSRASKTSVTPSFGAAGKQWNWSKLGAAKIRTDEHLIMRYLVSALKLTTSNIVEICNCDTKTAKNMIYGRCSRHTSRKNIDMLCSHLNTTYESLLDGAKLWHTEEEAEKSGETTVRIPSLTDEKEHYRFEKRWLDQLGLNLIDLVVMRQDTDFLLSECIRAGDILLVNKADTNFTVGSFYVAEIVGKPWVGMATWKEGKKNLAVDPSGKKFALEDFDELRQNGQIIGRCVWRGALM